MVEVQSANWAAVSTRLSSVSLQQMFITFSTYVGRNLNNVQRDRGELLEFPVLCWKALAIK